VKAPRKNQPAGLDLEAALKRICRVDLTRIDGVKVITIQLIRHERRKNKNRPASALRMAASILEKSDSYLGARFRSLRARLGPGKAIKAMAAYLARLIYRMLTRGQEWVDRGAAEFERGRKNQQQQSLQRLAKQLDTRWCLRLSLRPKTESSAYARRSSFWIAFS
jgi:hypothetical protein